MEMSNFKTMDLTQKAQYIKSVKNDIIGSYKQKNKYWQDGLIEVLLSNMDELEMTPDLLMSAYSIFVGYTNNFEEAYDTFKYQEEFSEKIVDNLTKAVELNEDSRVVDLGMQILRNLLVNNMLSTEKAMSLSLIKIGEGLVDNNKRTNLVAQIIAKLAKGSNDVKDQLMEQKTIMDSIINSFEGKGSISFRLSLLDCLISLSMGHERITNYVRENINISKLIAWIKYQHNEINAKVAYLSTILNSEKKISSDFENLIRQIIFKITRMSLSTETDEILEATTMLFNLVKCDDNSEVSSGKKSLGMHTCEIGAIEILTKILSKYVDEYLEFMRNCPKPKEEEKVDADMESVEGEGKKTPPKIVDKEANVEDVTGSFVKTRTIIINILKITKSLMTAHQGSMKKIISVCIPHQFFRLLDKIVGDEIRINTCEGLRILARAKKPVKIQIIEEDQDLEKMFKGLINDSNIEIQTLGLAIIGNFSIDFPGMILTFKEFMPRLKEFLDQDKNYELRLFSIKTLKNLLFIGHPDDVRRNAEKVIFEGICVKDLYVYLDDADPQIKEQAELIFKYLNQSMKKDAEGSDSKPKSVLENVDDGMMARIGELGKE